VRFVTLVIARIEIQSATRKRKVWATHKVMRHAVLADHHVRVVEKGDKGGRAPEKNGFLAVAGWRGEVPSGYRAALFGDTRKQTSASSTSRAN